MNKNDILTYFNAEKAESLLFVGIGALSLLAGLICLFYIKTRFAYGVAVPLILIALIQIVVGGTVYLRTDKQVETLLTSFNQSPAQYAATELPRMVQVNKSFDIYKIIEIVLLIVGLCLIGLHYTRTHAFWFGFGIALALQSSIMLAADLFAESRADLYTARIKSL